MQQIISFRSPVELANRLNEFLHDGWRLIGHVGAASVKKVAPASCPPHFKLEDGTTYETNYWALIGIEEQPDPEAYAQALAILADAR